MEKRDRKRASKESSKWQTLLENWDTVLQEDPNKIRKKCQKGIEASVRPVVWQKLSGAEKLRLNNPGLYETLKCSEDSPCKKVIGMDVPRITQHHVFLHKDDVDGEKDLREVLTAYSMYNSDPGYVPAIGFITGFLLRVMPPEECFWTLVAVETFYIPGYHTVGNMALLFDLQILEKLVYKYFPHVTRIYKDNGGFDMASHWMIHLSTLFVMELPIETTLWFWDIFLCEGINFLLKFSLSLMRLAFQNKEAKELPENPIASIPKYLLTSNSFLPMAVAFPLKDKDIDAVYERHKEDFKANSNYKHMNKMDIPALESMWAIRKQSFCKYQTADKCLCW